MKIIKIISIVSLSLILAVACKQKSTTPRTNTNIGGHVTVITNTDNTVITNIYIDNTKGIEQFNEMIFESTNKYTLLDGSESQNNIYLSIRTNKVAFGTSPSFSGTYLDLSSANKGNNYSFSGTQQKGTITFYTNATLKLYFEEIGSDTENSDLKNKDIWLNLYQYSNKN